MKDIRVCWFGLLFFKNFRYFIQSGKSGILLVGKVPESNNLKYF